MTGQPEALATLAALHPSWVITASDFGGFRAEHMSPDGRSVRYIAADRLQDLARALESAPACEPDA